MAYLLSRKVGSYTEETLREAISEMLDRRGLEWRGKAVLVKPNILGPFPPQSAVTTHPAVVRVLRDELRSRGSRVLVGDNPGLRGYGMFERTARVSGIAAAAGEDLVNLGLRARRVAIASRHTDHVSLAAEVLEVDHWVSVPKFKTHVSTVITGAIKNSYGLLVGGEKARLHAAAPRPRDFGELLVDVYAIRPPDLVILDGVVAMDGNGPSGGRAREVGLLLSSDSGGAIDLAMCQMAGIDPERVPHVACAMGRGLAPKDLSEVSMQGELPSIPGFKAPSTLVRLDPGGLAQKAIFHIISRPRIKVDRRRCDLCGSCQRACPADAVFMRGRYPCFDRGKCIACYCCYELCPNNAVRICGVARLLWKG